MTPKELTSTSKPSALSQQMAQRAAATAVSLAKPYFPKVAQTDVEKKFYADTKNLDFMAHCLTQPNGAEELKTYLVSLKINLPERDRILAFSATIFSDLHKAVMDLHTGVSVGVGQSNPAIALQTKIERGIRQGNPRIAADEMNKFQAKVNELNRQNGVPEISEVQVQQMAFNAAKNAGMKENEALNFIREAARLAGFTALLSLKGTQGLVGTAPGFTAMERQVAQNLMLAMNYDLYEIAEETAKKARDKGTEHREKEPAGAEKAEKEEKPKLSEYQLKDVNEFLAKSVGMTPAALAEAAVGQPRVETGKAPEKEVTTPTTFDGAAALKVPKAGKAKALKPSAARIRTAYERVAEYEKRGNAVMPFITSGKLEDQKERSARTGDTEGLKDYIKLILDRAAANPARFAASNQPKKQGTN